ncbi:hypothetical protein GPECTOR_9g462 [Gonium pectorale]|uniref:Protein kinase domain-containing protein n=1 Tax=Gonium pectorale TaxID=33097 RepID=A0A150GRQ2_GONPE|nr:hypothetical protein GPECTOR_9g462 [Gonium pectorale]|eukprot:KXZ52418.1 hypothetical protein GPECTOR_9g462 [Gonium pectorale]
MPLQKLLRIATQICQGLEYLHPTIVHRDLKPANVLINGADTDKPVVKLGDMYSLGVLLWVMLTGQQPWELTAGSARDNGSGGGAGLSSGSGGAIKAPEYAQPRALADAFSAPAPDGS